jgi:RecA-family ATPase
MADITPLQQPKQSLDIISASSWEGKPIEPQEWLIEGMIPMLTTTSLAGDGGLGKSLLAMQIMTACGAGKRFMNKDTKQCVSMGLFCEDRENQLHERQSNINKHYGIDWKDVVDVNYMPRVGHDNALVTSNYDKASPTEFFKEFRQSVLDIGAKLCVIDTAADTFMGNENIRTQVRYFVQLLNGLANDMQGAVLLLVHPSVAGLIGGTGTSGSTAWSNSVRSRWYLEKDKNENEPDSNIRILTQKKSNYSAVDNKGMELLWENGIFRIKLDEGGFIRKLEINNLAKQCLEVIEHYHSQNVNLSIYDHARTYAPKMIKDKLKSKHSYDDVKIAFNQLLDEKFIVNAPFGSPSKGQSRIILTNKQHSLLSTLEPIDI